MKKIKNQNKQIRKKKNLEIRTVTKSLSPLNSELSMGRCSSLFLKHDMSREKKGFWLHAVMFLMAFVSFSVLFLDVQNALLKSCNALASEKRRKTTMY